MKSSHTHFGERNLSTSQTSFRFTVVYPSLAQFLHLPVEPETRVKQASGTSRTSPANVSLSKWAPILVKWLAIHGQAAQEG